MRKKTRQRSRMTGFRKCQSWALSVFLNFFNNKNDFLHFYQVNLTGNWCRNRLLIWFLKNAINLFLSLKKFKNTESAQLWQVQFARVKDWVMSWVGLMQSSLSLSLSDLSNMRVSMVSLSTTAAVSSLSCAICSSDSSSRFTCPKRKRSLRRYRLMFSYFLNFLQI